VKGPIVKYRDCLSSAVHEWPIGSRCRLGYGLGWVQRSTYYRAQDTSCEGAIIRGKDIPRHTRRHSAVSCAKMAEPIDLPFGLWTRVDRRKQKLNRIRQVAPTCSLMRARWRHMVNTTESSVFRQRYGLMSNYFDHLFNWLQLNNCSYKPHLSSCNVQNVVFNFTRARLASAGIAVVVRLTVCPSVCHKSVFYWKG